MSKLIDNVTAYPLTWPVGWKRTPPGRRVPGRFARKGYSRDAMSSYRPTEDITIAQAIDRVRAELGRMRIRESNVIISSNLQLRQDGLPRSGQAQPADPGVAVYWRDSNVEGWPQRCMAIDLYTKVEQNIAAVAATLDAMRAIERHGGATVLDRAFTGFAALPAPIIMGSTRTWRDVLQLNGAVVDRDMVERVYRMLAAERHPDRGGSNQAMAELNVAREQALKEI